MDDYSLKFTWEILDVLPNDCDIYQFPRDCKDYSKQLLVRVSTREGKEWVGNFMGIDENYFTGVIPWPDGNGLCVISAGLAFLVRADDPQKFTEFPELPITNARYIPDQKMVLFATYDEIISYGQFSKNWVACGLAKDGIEITAIKDGKLFGVGDNILSKDLFILDLLTGKKQK